MRQGEVRGSRAADSDRLLLLRELPEAGRQFEQLACAPPVLDPDSGTGVILYRKDRVQNVMGQQYLERSAQA
jgi:hypothetical protein